MKRNFYPLKVLFLSFFLCSIYAGVYAQTMVVAKSVENITTGSDGTTASEGDILQYTITINNTSASNFINTKLYDNIPAGVSYVAGSTTLNAVSVSDASGKMPFASSGGLINSPSYAPGILSPFGGVVVTFEVKVTANGGSISNTATIDGTYNSVSVVNTTNAVFTNIDPDLACAKVYMSSMNSNGDYRDIKEVNTTTGAASTTYYIGRGTGGNGKGKDALTGVDLSDGAAINSTNGTAAIAYDKKSNRIYFVMNASGAPLSYINLSASSTAYVYQGYPVEPANAASGYNVNRMCFGSDGYGYALTSNAQHLIRFSVNTATNVPTITPMGTLLNDANNGASNSVYNETGGDMFADGSGKLYLIVNSSKMYKINPSTLIATYMGSVTPSLTSLGSSQSIAVDAAGNVYIGGAYDNVYKINLATMVRTAVSATGNATFSGDMTSCGFPVLSSAIVADKTAANYNGSSTVVGGDTVIYTITVTNTGNFNAAGVKLYDYIPPSTSYLPNSTFLNGAAVADVGGVMAFAVSGGRLVNSPGESGGILKPGTAYSAVVKFAVITEANKQICNQSKITLLDADGNIIFVNSSDPNNPGQTPTCFYSDGVLPSNNLKFKGSLNNEMSVLHWTISEDPNIASYEVEYSENGITFNTTGNVAGKDNGQINNYEFTDTRNIYSSLRYYRIKIIQKGGSFTYSGTIRLNVKGLDIQVIPNPFDKELNVQLQLKSKEQIRIRLIDFYGREVYTSSEQLGAGSHSLSLRIPSNLVKGMYVLEIAAGNNHVFQKKVLKR